VEQLDFLGSKDDHPTVKLRFFLEKWQGVLESLKVSDIPLTFSTSNTMKTGTRPLASLNFVVSLKPTCFVTTATYQHVYLLPSN